MRFHVASMVFWLLSVGVGSASGADLYSGKTFRATGVWLNGTLRASRIQLRDQEKDASQGQITGQIERLDMVLMTFAIGPFMVEWSDKTQFKEITAAALKSGSTVRVTGRVDGSRVVASSIQPASGMTAGAIQVIGIATTNILKKNAERELLMLGVPVVVTQAGYNAVESLIRRQDSRRPDQPFSVELLGRPLTITGEYDLTLRDRKNLKLDGKSDVVNLDHEAKIELFYPINDRTYAFLVGKGLYEAELRRVGGDRATDKSLARDQSWIFFDHIGGSNFGLQLGRQNFQETREWWWDDDKDAARVYYDNGPFHVEVGVGKELWRTSTLQHHVDPEDQDLVRFFGMGSWQWAAKQRLEFYGLRQNDSSKTETKGARLSSDREDPSDANLTWFGLRAIGNRSLDQYGELLYWLDTALVRGREKLIDFNSGDNGTSSVDSVKDVKVRGSAFDFGVSWQTKILSKPAFTLGYAQGSGDDSVKDGTDSAFRQTGLHNNKWRFFGVNRFRYYGELTRPELSNLGIVTAAVGWPLLNNSSVELVYHHYQQVKASKSLRDFRISADLTGKSKDIGQEVDLVFGFRDANHWDLSVGASAFRVGNAYGASSGKRAYGLLLEFTYNF